MKTFLASAALSLTVLGSAAAAPLTGVIDFTGTLRPDTGSLATANVLIFNGVDASGDGLFQDVAAASGDIAAFATVGQSAAFSDLVVDPLTAGQVTWAAGDLEFTLSTLSILFQNDETIALRGLGLLQAPGFDETEYNFVFTANTADGTLFSFSLSQAADDVEVPVPAPASLALLGSALVGLAVARRRRA